MKYDVSNKCEICKYRGFSISEIPCEGCFDYSNFAESVDFATVYIVDRSYTVPLPVFDEIVRLREQVYADCTCPHTDREGENACPVCVEDNKRRYGDSIPVEGVE